MLFPVVDSLDFSYPMATVSVEKSTLPWPSPQVFMYLEASSSRYVEAHRAPANFLQSRFFEQRTKCPINDCIIHVDASCLPNSHLIWPHSYSNVLLILVESYDVAISLMAVNVLVLSMILMQDAHGRDARH